MIARFLAATLVVAGTSALAAPTPQSAAQTSANATSPAGPLRVCFLDDDSPRANRATGNGFDLSVMKAVAADAGVALEPVWTPSRSGFSEVDATDLPLGRLTRGECDAAASIPGEESLGRSRDLLALSRPYYGAAFELVAAANGPSTLAALEGRRVGVQLQSFAHLVAQSLHLDWRARPTPGETIALLDAGEVDAALVWGPALATVKRAPQSEWWPIGWGGGGTPPRALRWNEHVAVRTGSPWLAVVDRALERLEAEGAIERMAREAGIPSRPPFTGTSDASALGELRRELAIAKR